VRIYVRAQTCAEHYTSSVVGQTAGPTGARISANTHWNNGHKLWGRGRRSQVRIGVHAVRANVHVALYIQHRLPNGWAVRGPNWYKHSLEQWAQTSYGGRRSWVRIDARAARANVHTANWYKTPLGQCAQVMGVDVRAARERARSARIQGWHRAQQLRVCGARAYCTEPGAK
jgi:hypothetical protein